MAILNRGFQSPDTPQCKTADRSIFCCVSSFHSVFQPFMLKFVVHLVELLHSTKNAVTQLSAKAGRGQPPSELSYSQFHIEILNPQAW